MEWLSQYALAIQAVAAVGILLLTCALVWATWRYASRTKEALELARKQFEEEWRLDLHLDVRRFSGDDVSVRVTNLARRAVLLKGVKIRVGTEEGVPMRWYRMHVPLLVGDSKNFNIYDELVRCLIERELIPQKPEAGRKWQGIMGASIVFYSAGKSQESEWVNFKISMRNGEVYGLEPTAPRAEARGLN